MIGIDEIIETFIDLWVGEVRREYAHDMASVRYGVRDGLIGITSIPITSAEGCKRWYSAIETI